MDLETTLRYPLPPDAVAALLADPSFVEELCRSSQSTSYEVSVEGDAEAAFAVTTQRVLSTQEFPDAIRRLLGPTLTLDQVDTWEGRAPDGSRRATTRLVVPGTPVAVTAEHVLRPVGSGSEQAVNGTVKASIPLIGGRVEKAAAPFLLSALSDQERMVAARAG